jgi:Tfp pilus assembly protein PilX
MFRKEKGVILVAVIAVAVIFAIIGLAVLTLAEQEAILGRIEADKTRAFYYAEAGLAKMQEKLQKPVVGVLSSVIEETMEKGRYSVAIDTNQNPCYAISTGASGTVQKKIRVKATFLATPFENAIYAMNSSGNSWALQLRGIGNPVASGGRERGGKDKINGNIFVDGDAFLYEESSVNPAPAPNKWALSGDVGATGSVNVLGSASVSGEKNPNAEEPELIDVRTMDYANNNTHNVAQIFQAAGVSSGYLPSGNPLRNVFVKNPSDRAAECGTTTGNDYFFEPSTGFVLGQEKQGKTPLNAGTDRVYYVDGDVWVHSKDTYGFKMDGKVTIIATGDIHICDNIEYANKDSLLGLVAAGKYNSSGERVSGGDIFFGDPRYGTMYTIAGLMFAANDFLYNTDSVTRSAAEPTTGFTINGSYAAMGRVTVERDWYTKGSTARPAHYDSAVGQWKDSLTGTALSSTEISSIKHYQMIVNYDERVRDQETCPPGLPRGGGRIFAGFSNWEEL